MVTRTVIATAAVTEKNTVIVTIAVVATVTVYTGNTCRGIITATMAVTRNMCGNGSGNGNSDGNGSSNGKHTKITAKATATATATETGTKKTQTPHLHAVSELGEDDGPGALPARLVPREVLS